MGITDGVRDYFAAALCECENIELGNIHCYIAPGARETKPPND